MSARANMAHKKTVTEIFGTGTACALRAVPGGPWTETPATSLLRLSKPVRGVPSKRPSIIRVFKTYKKYITKNKTSWGVACWGPPLLPCSA